MLLKSEMTRAPSYPFSRGILVSAAVIFSRNSASTAVSSSSFLARNSAVATSAQASSKVVVK